MDRRSLALGAAALALTSPALAQAARPRAFGYSTHFYKSGGLAIEAYLYRPTGKGPFPLVIYNHGSRFGEERQSFPFRFIGDLFAGAGYAVLVPERRGYGHSEGATFAREVGNDKGPRFVERQQREADDVLAARDFAATLPFVDTRRVALAGWSFGGIVTLLAAARGSFQAVIDQAGGAINWAQSAALREAMRAAVVTIKAPMLLAIAENDATMAAITELAVARRSAGLPAETHVYPAFSPRANRLNYPPGHMIFGEDGAHIWAPDALRFLAENLKA